MLENLYQQRGREEVGWGEREGGSGLGREGGRKWDVKRGREEVGWGEQRGRDRQGCREERKEGDKEGREGRAGGIRSVGTLHCTTHATQV